MLLLDSKWWWVPTVLGVVVSQILIFTAWNDAKAGSIANAILLLPIIVTALGVAPGSFSAMYNHDIAVNLNKQSQQPKLLTKADIAHLPSKVQRYLKFVGAVDKPQVWNYHLHFRGALRNSPNQKWMPMTAEQQSFVTDPARLFLVDSSMFGVPFTAFHRYVGPEATFRVRLASLLTMVDAKRAEMNKSETVTLFNDMVVLAPSTLIDPNIVWEELDPLTVRATWTNEGNTISAILSFDESGALTNFVSDDRYRTDDGKTFENIRWSTSVSDWRMFDGRKLPVKGEAVWQLSDGEFQYGQFEILNVEYNVMP
jgi:hypothetical protein